MGWTSSELVRASSGVSFSIGLQNRDLAHADWVTIGNELGLFRDQ